MDKRYFERLCDATAKSVHDGEAFVTQADAEAICATLAAVSSSIRANEERDPRILALSIRDTIGLLRGGSYD
jgi:hypothetical protein